MIAFEAATPFQVFNCMNLLQTRHLGEKADLYLYTYAGLLRSLAERAARCGLFARVSVLENTPKPGRWNMVKSLLWPSALTRGVELGAYDALYISYSGIPNLILYNLLYRKSPGMKLYFYEDGVTSYYNGLFRHAKSVDTIRKLRGLQNDSEHVEEIFLYEPRLNRVSYRNREVRKLETGSGTDFYRKVNDCFAVTEEAMSLLRRSRYLYFDHDYRKYVGDKFFFRFEQNEIANELAEIAGEMLVKVSPLTDPARSGYAGPRLTVTHFERAPWEALCLQDAELENRCLITVCSNAVITPKSVLGREPRVLILGKALYQAGLTNSVDVWTEDMGKYYEQVHSLYRRKERFLVAETMEDARAFLRDFSAESKSAPPQYGKQG